jgi:hypothetical protein
MAKDSPELIPIQPSHSDMGPGLIWGTDVSPAGALAVADCAIAPEGGFRLPPGSWSFQPIPINAPWWTGTFAAAQALELLVGAISENMADISQPKDHQKPQTSHAH